MGLRNTYIQQLHFDGETYTKGEVVNLTEKWGIYCDVPFKLFPEAKELAVRDWAGEDGRDVYIPKKIPLAAYELEVEVTYKGEDAKMRDNIEAFIKFIYGRNDGAVGGRLAIYDEYTGIGRKDIHVTSIDNDIYYDVDYDDEQCAKFNVKFQVEDPATDVKPSVSGNKVNDLIFS